jgi:uncharacterized protein YdeI (YjbR/CyaY-like superfamily)
MEHHAQVQGAWIVTFKKGCSPEFVGADAIAEEALCFGWIDSRPAKLDATRTMLLVTPRKPGSGWSRLNKARVEKLQASGQMTPRGLEVVDASKASGTWTMLDDVEDLRVPEDLLSALKSQPGAIGYFEAFPRSAKRGILEWILQAKRPETRQARILETARLASLNKRANSWPRE